MRLIIERTFMQQCARTKELDVLHAGWSMIRFIIVCFPAEYEYSLPGQWAHLKTLTFVYTYFRSWMNLCIKPTVFAFSYYKIWFWLLLFYGMVQVVYFKWWCMLLASEKIHLQNWQFIYLFHLFIHLDHILHHKVFLYIHWLRGEVINHHLLFFSTHFHSIQTLVY